VHARADTRDTAGAPVPDFAAGPVVGIAAGAVVLLLAFGARNGFHRDELYFLAASRHMAWGYVDQPPGAVAVAWLDSVAFGSSLFWLRVIPALFMGGIVVATGATARELGGSRFAQGFAALCVATGGYLVIGHLEGPTVYDAFASALVSWLVIRTLRTGNQRLWLAVGASAGVALEAKQTILMLLAGLAIGFLCNRQTDVFRSKWLWTGAGLALVLWSPNLAWGAAHGFPSRRMDASLRAEHSGIAYAVKYPFIVLVVFGAFVAPVWTSGWWALLRRARWHAFRAFAIAYALALVALWIVIPDRFYYLAGFYPVLIAAGAIVTEGVVDGAHGFFRAAPRRGALWRSRRWAVGIVAVSGLLFLPVALPVLSPAALADVPLQNVNYNLGEEVGWHELVREVTSVDRALPPAQRDAAVILTSNYGEAGALERFGSASLPRVYSGHNSYSWWGPPVPNLGTTIAIGLDRDELTPYFSSVKLAARIHNRYGVDNDEEGAPVWVATGQKSPWSKIWPRFRHYG
jgi:hypothetical protein